MSINTVDDSIATPTLTEGLKRHTNNSYRLQRRRRTEEYKFNFKENCLFLWNRCQNFKQLET